jgi:hypothetical protein
MIEVIGLTAAAIDGTGDLAKRWQAHRRRANRAIRPSLFAFLLPIMAKLGERSWQSNRGLSMLAQSPIPIAS